MSDRADELKGNLKEGAGKLTGNTEMQAEGRGEKELAQGRRQVKGAANQVKANIEQGIGRMTGDESTQAQGATDEIKGDTQRTG